MPRVPALKYYLNSYKIIKLLKFPYNILFKIIYAFLIINLPFNSSNNQNISKISL